MVDSGSGGRFRAHWQQERRRPAMRCLSLKTMVDDECDESVLDAIVE